MVLEDRVTSSIGNIGKWQWLVILPIALREIFTGWQMILTPFLAKESKFWCKNQTSDDTEDQCLIANKPCVDWEFEEGTNTLISEVN